VSLNNFLAELKRRNVYKIAIAYGVVAWLLIQIASQIFPFFDIPSWAVRLVVLLLIIGFPIALIFSWAFEMTPAGIKRTEDVAPGGAITRGTGRKLDLLIIGVLLAVITILIFPGSSSSCFSQRFLDSKKKHRRAAIRKPECEPRERIFC